MAEIGTDMEPLPHIRSPGELGGDVSGQRRERGQAPERQDAQGQPLAALDADRSRPGGGTQQGNLSGGAVPPARRTRGTKRAAVAVGHTILVIAYRLLSEGDVYRDLGDRYFDERDRHAVERRLVARLEGLGYKVSLDPAA